MMIIFHLCLVAALFDAGCALTPERNARNEIAAAALRHRFRDAPDKDTIVARLEIEGVDVDEVIHRTALAERQVVLLANKDIKDLEGRIHENRPDKSIGLLHLSINKFSETAADVLINCEWGSATVIYSLKLEKRERGWEVVKENLDDIE
jgi:hypothetical protein